MNEFKNRILQGDCLEVLQTMPDNSVDSVVTDPPYGLSKEPDIREVLTKWMAGGTVLDPFAGSGSTLVAAKREGFDYIGIEREPEYVEIARARTGEKTA